MVVHPRELRLGNLITVSGINTPLVVHALLDATILLKDGDNTPDGYYYTSTRPIAITEEWLFKFGFKYQDRDINSRKLERFYLSNYFGQGEYWIEFNLASEDKRSFTWLNWDIGGGRRHVHLPTGDKLIYVHQLQNLYFALTGNELEIKELV